MFKQCMILHIHKTKTDDFQLRDVAEAEDENHNLELFLIYSSFFFFYYLEKKRMC